MLDYTSFTKYTEVTAVQWDPTGCLLAVANSVGEINLIDHRKKTIVGSISKKSYQGVRSLHFSSNRKNTLFTAGSDGQLVMYDYSLKDQCLKTWSLHQNKITMLKCSEDSPDILITGGLDQMINVVDVREKSGVSVFEVSFPITAGNVLKGNHSLILGGYYGEVVGVDLRKSNCEVMKYTGHSKTTITSVDVVKNKSIDVKREKKQSIKEDGRESICNTSLMHIKEKPPLIPKNINAEPKTIEKKEETRVAEAKTTVVSIPETENVSMREKDKEEIKEFVRKEINVLRVDMIRELEHQKNEIKKFLREMLDQSQAKNRV